MRTVVDAVGEGSGVPPRHEHRPVDPGSRVEPGSALVVLAGGVAFANGMLMLLGPAQFASAAYAFISPYLAIYGLVLALTGFTVLSFAATGRPMRPALAAAVPLVLIPLWVDFIRAGLVTGVVTLGVQMAAAVLAGTGLFRRLRVTHPTLAMIGVLQSLQAVAMVAVPQQFAVPVLYGSFSALLWLFAPSFAIAGIGLLVARRPRWIVAFGTLAAANFGALAITFLGTRLWTGVANYGAMVFLVLLALSNAPTGVQAMRLLFGATGLIALADLVRWGALLFGARLPIPDAAVLRPLPAGCLVVIGVIGLWSLSSFGGRRARRFAGIAALAVIAAAVFDLRDVLPDARVLSNLGPGDLDPRTSTTSLFLLSLAATAVGAPLVWTRVWATTTAVVSAIILATVAGANLFAYLIDQPALFAAFGIVTLRLHTALALVTAAAAVLLRLAPAVSRSSVAGRLALAFGAILALVALEAFISISSSTGLIASFLSDPADAERQAQSATNALVGLLVLIGFVSIVIAYAVTRSITVPFRQLSHAMRAFAQGDRGARVVVHGRDEVARAGLTFNAMARELQDVHTVLVDHAMHDALTGLPNRRLLADRLQQALAGAARNTGSVSVLGLDLNGFKRVNDRLGHAAGDQVLVAVAARLLAAVRLGDTVARPGGDEFTIILPGADRSVARIVAGRIEEQLRAPMNIAGEALTIGASIGIATSPLDGSTEAALLAVADRELYGDKNDQRVRSTGLDDPRREFDPGTRA